MKNKALGRIRPIKISESDFRWFVNVQRVGYEAAEAHARDRRNEVSIRYWAPKAVLWRAIEAQICKGMESEELPESQFRELAADEYAKHKREAARVRKTPRLIEDTIRHHVQMTEVWRMIAVCAGIKRSYDKGMCRPRSGKRSTLMAVRPHSKRAPGIPSQCRELRDSGQGRKRAKTA